MHGPLDATLEPVRDQADVDAVVARGWPDDLPCSTYDLLAVSAERFGEADALSFFVSADRHQEVVRWSYQQLFADVTRAANAFHALGVRPGDGIAYLLPNLPETHFTLWGAEAAGVAVAINPLLEPEAIGALLAASGATVLVTLSAFPGTDLFGKAMRAATMAPALRHVVLVDPAHHVRGWRRIASRLLSWKAARGAPMPPKGVRLHRYAAITVRAPHVALSSRRVMNAGDVSSCFCTGGTTGLPKLARRTHGSEVANAWMTVRMFGTAMAPGTVVFCGLPLFHVNAAMVTGLAAFLTGAHVLVGTPQGYRGSGVTERFWEIVAKHRVAIFSGVPTLFATLLKNPVADHNLSSLRFAFCGAAPMPADLIARFETATGIPILEGYGLTEGTCVSSVNPLAGPRRPGSVGLSLPFQEMRPLIFDEYGGYVRGAETDETGRLAISGPNVFSGYVSKEHNVGIWIDRRDGRRWFDTGDIGRIDAEGYVWLTGRAKEIIIRGGHNIDPAMIEEALQRHPAVVMAAAVGRPDAHAGEVPVVYAQLHGGSTITEEDLLAFAERQVPERAAWPKAVHIVETLPLTAIGKTFKPVLVEREIERLVLGIMTDAGITSMVTTRRTAGEPSTVVAVVPVEYVEAITSELARYTFRYEVSVAC